MDSTGGVEIGAAANLGAAVVSISGTDAVTVNAAATLGTSSFVLGDGANLYLSVAQVTGRTVTDSAANSMLVVTGMAADTNFGAVLGSVTLDGDGTSVVVAYVASDLTMSGGNFTNVDVISIAAGATLTMTGLANGFGGFGLGSQVITGEGHVVLNTTTGIDTFDLSAITQSSFTGTLTINASDGADVFTGTSGNDIINCGAGADNVTGGAGADILTGEAGADIFIFAAAHFTATDGAGLVAGADTIADWLTDADLIDFGGTTLAAIEHANGIGAAGTANITATGFATFHADDDTLAEKLAAVVTAVGTDAAGTSVVFTDGGHSYLFVVGDATADIQAGDALIKLTGIIATDLTFSSGDISAVA